jgi:hypothetical protein
MFRKTRRQETLEKRRDFWGYGGEMGIEARATLREVSQDLRIEFSRDYFPVGAQKMHPKIAPWHDCMVGVNLSPFG